ncbi:MAG: PHP domain-containing protein [Polyangiaceae bacterium]
MRRIAIGISLIALSCGGGEARLGAPTHASTAPNPSGTWSASPPEKKTPDPAKERASDGPAAASMSSPTFLKGQLHVHSAGSYDAREPAEEVLKFYAEHGYRFVSITDHNRVTVAPSPTQDMLVFPGVELTQNATQCEPAPSPGFRCLFHTGAVFLHGVSDGQELKLPFQAGRFAAYDAQLGLAEKLGGIGMIMHPNFHFAVDARLLARLVRRGAKFFEVSNAALDSQHPGGHERAEAHAESLWDGVLAEGLIVYGVATDDAHHFSEAESRRKQMKSAYTGDRGWVQVYAEPNEASIRRALERGEFYASSGVELSSLARDPRHWRVEIQAAEGEQYETRFIGSGGKELAKRTGPIAEYDPRGDEGYVRAVVRDSQGHKAWIQPQRLR